MRTDDPPAEGGLLLLDKPVGPSSFALVRETRRTWRAKAGHAGTLDPRASGLLLVLLGRATRLARYLVGLDKRYETEIVLGQRTSTGDSEGDPLPGGSVPDDVEAAVAALVGAIELRVPAASAVKIDGTRAYRLHRCGVDVEMPLRRSDVLAASILARAGARLTVDLHVSSGTYVRAIADVLGGHCASLRRTAVGPFRVEDADPGRLVPAADALPFLEAIELDAGDVARVARGLPVPATGQGAVRLLHRGSLVAVARAAGGTARPQTVLGVA